MYERDDAHLALALGACERIDFVNLLNQPRPVLSERLVGQLRFKDDPELEAILPQIAAFNRRAMEVALKFDIHACTDVTGFGILGHTLELAQGSDVQIDLMYDRLPFYANALRMYQKGETTGSNKANRKMVEGFWEISTNKSSEEQELLFDPQTSGGLLLAVPDSQADDLIARLKKEGVETAVRVGSSSLRISPISVLFKLFQFNN